MTIQVIEGTLLHEFRNEDRLAQIYSHKNAYVVRMFENRVWKEDRIIKGHSESYAEDCADNFVQYIF